MSNDFSSSLNATQAAALNYLSSGFQPIRVKARSKAPIGDAWQHTRLTEAQIRDAFAHGENVGVLLGEVSGGLVDCDLDTPEAIVAAGYLLPKTVSFGRQSKRRSHCLFTASGCPTVKYTFNLQGNGKRATICELRANKKDGAGMQTVFPPSTHPSGEAIEWDDVGEPVVIDATVLQVQMGRVAAAALIAIYWKTGLRHDGSLALIGGLARAGWSEVEIATFLTAVCAAANDEEAKDRLANIKSTLNRVNTNATATGWPRLAELLGKKVVGKVIEWLGIDTSFDPHDTDDFRNPGGIPPRSTAGVVSEPPAPKTPKPVLKWIPFPVHVLPKVMRRYVEEAASAVGCDHSYVALPMLAALASVVGNKIRISIKKDWSEPCIIWSVIVGLSGTKKSPPLELALRVLQKIQKRLRKEFKKQMQEHAAKLAEYQARMMEWKRGKRITDAPIEPETPKEVKLLVDDVTVEALAAILDENWVGVLMSSDELATWFAGFDRYSPNGRSGDAAKWIKVHGGRLLIVDRRTKPALYIDRAAASVTGGIQPGILARTLNREMFQSGLAARLLLAYPPRKVVKFSEADISNEAESAMEQVLNGLFNLEHAIDDVGDPAPHLIGFAADAKAKFVEFYNEHAEEQVKLDGDEDASWAKLTGYCARLSLVIHLVRWVSEGGPTTNAVDLASVEAAIELCCWFGREAQRVYALLSESVEEREQRELADWLRGRGDVGATARDLTKSKRRYKDTPALAEAHLRGLVKAGLATSKIESPAGGGAATTRYFAVPVPTRHQNIKENEACGDGDTSSASKSDDWGEVE